METAMYSMLTYLAASKTVDFIINGIEEYIGVMIVSRNSEAIKNNIVSNLGRGVTILKSEKGYGKKGNEGNDGNVLFFNCLISDNGENLLDFPLLSDKQLFENDEYEMALFESSSTIPHNLKKLLPTANQSDEETKGLVLGSIDSVIRFLNIGTYTLKNISN